MTENEVEEDRQALKEHKIKEDKIKKQIAEVMSKKSSEIAKSAASASQNDNRSSSQYIQPDSNLATFNYNQSEI